MNSRYFVSNQWKCSKIKCSWPSLVPWLAQQGSPGKICMPSDSLTQLANHQMRNLERSVRQSATKDSTSLLRPNPTFLQLRKQFIFGLGLKRTLTQKNRLCIGPPMFAYMNDCITYYLICRRYVGRGELSATECDYLIPSAAICHVPVFVHESDVWHNEALMCTRGDRGGSASLVHLLWSSDGEKD